MTACLLAVASGGRILSESLTAALRTRQHLVPAEVTPERLRGYNNASIHMRWAHSKFADASAKSAIFLPNRGGHKADLPVKTEVKEQRSHHHAKTFSFSTGPL